MGHRECRPGGSCPTCNPKPDYCQGCLTAVVENVKDLCPECDANRREEENGTCLRCGTPLPDEVKGENHPDFCTGETCWRRWMEGESVLGAKGTGRKEPEPADAADGRDEPITGANFGETA